MELDLNKFRTLVPISALYEDSLLYLAERTRVDRLGQGGLLFDIGDDDPDSIFLISGELRLISDDNLSARIRAGSEEAQYALANFRPRQFKAEVTSNTATVARVPPMLLEKLLAWGQVAPDQVPEARASAAKGPGVEESEWMMTMLQTPVFLKLPSSNIQTLFSRIEPVVFTQGEVIIEMGAQGDYYYIVREGRCKVSRPAESGETTVAELGPYDSFCEEALISDATRNANVTALGDCRLMRLSKYDFLELLEEPLLNWADAQTADRLLGEGAIRVDVRLENEYHNSGLPGAVNIPLQRLRDHIPDLNRLQKYILYCDTGQRSSAGAFLLGQSGFDTYVLKGGISQRSS